MARRWIATVPGDLDGLVLESVELGPPGPGEVQIEVRAAGVNPADYKHLSRGAPEDYPRPIGYEVAGVVTALGEGAELASGGGAVGEEVLAFRVAGGWATALNVPGRDVFAKPAGLSFEAAANLLLAGATASEMLHVVGARSGETILVHGASGAVGVAVLQLARIAGVRVLATASAASFDRIARYGGEPIRYGAGLLDRVRAAAPDGIAAALDCVGTDEAIEVSLATVPDRDRIVTIAAAGRAGAEGLLAIGGTFPASRSYRDEVRAELIDLAGRGELEVPLARSFPLAEARAAIAVSLSGHPGGKLTLFPA
ncbi:MAG: zinc-binding dehydrogenase [Nocardioides sp.]|uniref:quinone oxidoreductase family protein n=1 Tax=Nocardioides sp. TaxID=35761 RepID=UPI0039E5FFF4